LRRERGGLTTGTGVVGKSENCLSTALLILFIHAYFSANH